MATNTRLRAYRLTLEPTPAQRQVLARHAGAARWAYNYGWALKHPRQQEWFRRRDELVSAGYTDKEAKQQAKRDVRVPNKGDIQKFWNSARGDNQAGVDGVCPWWREVSTYAFQSAWDDLDRAWGNWLSSLAGTRAGEKVGHPRLKKKHRSRDSFRLHHDAKKPTIRVETYRRIRMPRVGSVRLHDSAKRLHRAVQRGGVVRSVTVSRSGRRWHASVLVSEPDVTPGRETQSGPSVAQQKTGRVGVDVGVKHLVALSTGEVFDNPRHLQRAGRRLKRAQRRMSRRVGPDRRTERVPSRRWRKAKYEVGKIHSEVAEQRRAYLHQLTKRLATGHVTVAVEDLNVTGMTASARGTAEQPGSRVAQKSGLNRAILDVAPGELRRQLTYKTGWYGSWLAVADRWFPSSKTCSACGVVKPKLPLSVRVFSCESCDMRLDRDVNAARNIAAAAVVASDRGETLNARGADVRPRHAGAVGVEAIEGPDGSP